MYTKLVPEKVNYINFHFKLYLESILSIYHLYNLFGIICKSAFYH